VRVYLRTTMRRRRLNARRLTSAAQALMRAAGAGDATLSLSLVGDAAMRRLNREHRGKDRATDVLSFPLLSHAERRRAPARAPGAAGERLLGDVVISLDTAARQASAYGATLDAEVRRLLIHGILHLLGFDHERPRDRARMRTQERRLADAIALPWPYG
jgi:probable rRNA maturation factor